MAPKAREHVWNFSGQILAALIGAFAVIVAAVIAIKFVGDSRTGQAKVPEISAANETSPTNEPVDVAEKPVPANSMPTAKAAAPKAVTSKPSEPQHIAKVEPHPRAVTPVRVAAPPQRIIKQACVIENSVIDQPTSQDCTGVSQ
jgi:hypothetical protein